MGCWSIPNTIEKAKAVRALMSKPLDARIATDELYPLVGDDELFDYLDDAVDESKHEDVRPLVLTHLQGWLGKRGDDEKLREEWGFTDPFAKGALDIFKKMLTAWDHDKSYPA